MANCKALKPSACGDRGLVFPSNGCGSIRFEGVGNAETNQGDCIDLTEGVHAYDGNGDEIPYTVEPTELDCCEVGEYEVTYTASGMGNKKLPSLCLGKPMLHFLDCGIDTKVVKRIVKILQALPPKILGAVRTVISPGTWFDPMEGVSGIDDNGNPTEVTFEGRYDVTTGKVAIASFESDIEQNAKSVVANISPKQDLHGYDAPWVGGAGKNLLQKADSDISSLNGITMSVADDGTLTLNGTTTEVSFVRGAVKSPLAVAEYTFASFNSVSENLLELSLRNNDYGSSGGWHRINAPNRVYTFTSDSEAYYWQIQIPSGVALNNFRLSPMLVSGSTVPTAYSPYSNICPISGWDSVETYVSPTTTASDGTTYTTPLGRTVYGGTLDVVSGVLTVDRAMVDLGSLTWSKFKTSSGQDAPYIYGSTSIGAVVNVDVNPICSAYQGETKVASNLAAYNRGNGTCCFLQSGDNRFYVRDDSLIDLSASDFKTAMNGVQLVYKLSTPQTYQLTPTEVQLLSGTNNVWSNSGDTTVVYSEPIPNGSTKFDIEGAYPITYHTEDECGNETTVVRWLIVGDCEDDETLPMLCQGRLCCATLDCSEELPLACYATACNAMLICEQTEVTPTLA